jgi:hypothetical protein
MENPQITVVYHFPCLDGAYSAMMTFLGLFQYLAKFEKTSIRTLLDRIENANNPTRSPIVAEDPPKDNVLSVFDLYNVDFDKNVSFYAYKRLPGEDMQLKYILERSNPSNLLIFVDCYGSNESFLKEAIMANRHTVIIDHHKSCESLMKSPEFTSIPPGKLTFYYDSNKCGATLAMQYFEEKLGIYINFESTLRSKLIQVALFACIPQYVLDLEYGGSS